jgi:hypothetical protein
MITASDFLRLQSGQRAGGFAPLMIRLWLSRDKSIPVQEQLGAQLLFGILSRKVAPGERLPSVRALARRLKGTPEHRPCGLSGPGRPGPGFA